MFNQKNSFVEDVCAWLSYFVHDYLFGEEKTKIEGTQKTMNIFSWKKEGKLKLEGLEWTLEIAIHFQTANSYLLLHNIANHLSSVVHE